MGAFIGIIGVIGIIVGIVLIVVGLVKKKKLKGGIVVIISLVLFVTGVAITPKQNTDYEVIQEEKQGNGLYIRVETEGESEKELRTVVEKIKKEKKSSEIDAAWILIYEHGEQGGLLAKAKVPYNKNGQTMVGANNKDYLFELNPNKKEVKQEIKKANSEPISWEERIQKISSSGVNKTEKFDEVSSFAMEYNPTETEIDDFQTYIINEYKNGNYINNLANDEYALGNIFKSQVVERNTKNKHIKDFAFDFWQNSKYIYRGVDAPDSTTVKSNEQQMDKALTEIGE